MATESDFSLDDLNLLALVLRNRQPELGQLLSEKSFAPDVLGEALVLASRKGKVELVRQLLDAGAPIDGVGYRGKTPLSAAFGEGKLALSQLLLTEGATDPGGRIAKALTPDPADKKLIQAVRKKDIPGIDAALAEGANLLARDLNNATLLRIAASRGNPQVIRHLFAAQTASSSFAVAEVFEAMCVVTENHREAAHVFEERLLELGVDEERRRELEEQWRADFAKLFAFEDHGELRRARDNEILRLIAEKSSPSPSP